MNAVRADAITRINHVCWISLDFTEFLLSMGIPDEKTNGVFLNILSARDSNQYKTKQYNTKGVFNTMYGSTTFGTRVGVESGIVPESVGPSYGGATR